MVRILQSIAKFLININECIIIKKSTKTYQLFSILIDGDYCQSQACQEAC
jgi:hypothetical protein